MPMKPTQEVEVELLATSGPGLIMQIENGTSVGYKEYQRIKLET